MRGEERTRGSCEGRRPEMKLLKGKNWKGRGEEGEEPLGQVIQVRRMTLSFTSVFSCLLLAFFSPRLRYLTVRNIQYRCEE